MTPKSPEAETQYLNVDLELTAGFDLSSLVEALGPEVFTLHVEFHDGNGSASLELADEANAPDEAIQTLVERVKRLDDDGRRWWNACSRRVFDIGIQSGLTPHMTAFRLQSTTVHNVASVSAEIVVTVYGTAQTPPTTLEP